MADSNGTGFDFGNMAATDETTGAGAAGNLTFDFSTVNENSFGELWSPGTYPAYIEDATFGFAQTSGNPMITCTYIATDPETGKSRKFWDRLVFVEGALPRVKRTLSRIAPQLIAEGRQFDPRVDCDELIGIHCQIKIRTKPYEGQPRNEISEVLPAEEVNSVLAFS